MQLSLTVVIFLKISMKAILSTRFAIADIGFSNLRIETLLLHNAVLQTCNIGLIVRAGFPIIYRTI